MSSCAKTVTTPVTDVHRQLGDPLAHDVLRAGARIRELAGLHVDRDTGEEPVAAAVVEVQVRADDDVDAGEIEVLLAQRIRQESRSATAGCNWVMPVSTSTRASGWSMTWT